MNIFKIKINKISTSCAIILGSSIISVSIFVTTWIFFGENNNKQKLLKENQTTSKNTPPILSPDQIKKIQEQRDAQKNKQIPVDTSKTNE